MPINFPKIVDNKMKLNSFVLSRDIIKKMENFVESSLFNNKEMGFNLCKKNNELVDDFEWYYFWDVATGCIWNLDKVKIELM